LMHPSRGRQPAVDIRSQPAGGVSRRTGPDPAADAAGWLTVSSKMTRFLCVLALLAAPAVTTAQQRSIPYTPGMVITASTRIAPGTYHIPTGDSVGIVIRGNGITVDMRGVELVGDTVR